MTTFKELLGTGDKKEQIEKIEELLKIAATPEVSLLIQYNGLEDRIALHILGGDVAFDIIHRMLELAGKAIRREEVNTAVQQQAENGKDKDPGE